MPKRCYEYTPFNWPAQHYDEISFLCPWNIELNGESLSVTIDKLRWSNDKEFWTAVRIYPEDDVSRIKTIEIQPGTVLSTSLVTALRDYLEFPEPHLAQVQLDSLEELVECLEQHWKNFWSSIED